MTLPEALELLSYLAENPPTHRVLAIVHKLQRKDRGQGAGSVPLTPELLQAMAPSGILNIAGMAGYTSQPGNPSG